MASAHWSVIRDYCQITSVLHMCASFSFCYAPVIKRDLEILGILSFSCIFLL